MRDAFTQLDLACSDDTFLDVFRAAGCYLVDLCHDPVDHLDSKSRKAACRANETVLSSVIKQLRPARIATVVHSIERNVTRAVALASWHGPWIRLPYPGRWSHHRALFTEELLPTITKLMDIHK